MAEIIIRQTFGTREDILVYDDGSVVVDGLPAPNAVISEYEGVTRVSIDGNEVIDINPAPDFIELKIVREPGWNGVIGWRCTIENLRPDLSPGVNAIAVYSGPEADGYLFTTGAFVLDNDKWTAICPPGFEPGEVAPVHFGLLYASLLRGYFSMWEHLDEIIVQVGGEI